MATHKTTVFNRLQLWSFVLSVDYRPLGILTDVQELHFQVVAHESRAGAQTERGETEEQVDEISKRCPDVANGISIMARKAL